jgi:hypothetical protein
METNKRNWHEILLLLKAGNAVEGFEIVFNEEKIDVKTVALLNKHGFRVPENLIFYDDNDINFDDDPELNEEDFENGHWVWHINASVTTDLAIKAWIENEKIDTNKLLSKLLSDFYKNKQTTSGSN